MVPDTESKTNILCQCKKCNLVFDYGSRKKIFYGSLFRYVCPQCGGTFTLIRPEQRDRYFLDKHLFEIHRKREESDQPDIEDDYSDGNQEFF